MNQNVATRWRRKGLITARDDGAPFPGDRRRSDRRRESREIRRLLHDLDEHQVELVARNEELRRTQEALERARDRYFALFELAPIAYLTLDAEGIVLEANATALGLLGGTRDALIGKPFARRIAAADAARFEHHRRVLLASGGKQRCELGLRRADGRPLRVLLESIADRDAATVVWRTAVVDLSERERLEAERRQAQKMEAVGTLASGVAHDFNNLLMGLTGVMERVLGTLDASHPSRRELQLGLESARRSSDVAHKLLRVARHRDAEPVPVGLDDAVKAMVPLLRRTLGEHIRVKLDVGAPAVQVMMEPGTIEQILMNLGTNARDAMPGGGTLAIRTTVVVSAAAERVATARGSGTHATAAYVRLTLEDTGSGMDDATRERMFEPFFTTKDVGRGTGLGLSTVFAIVEGLGGHIDVASAPDRGTTVTLWLPALEESPVGAGDAEPIAVPEARTVLLVEDQRLVRKTVRTWLEELGHVVIEASGPRQARRLAAEQLGAIELLVTDVAMPRESGPSLAADLRTRHTDLAVLFMSGHGREDLVADGRLPADAALIEKPFDLQTFQTALQSLLGA